jgi:hypothetical protein
MIKVELKRQHMRLKNSENSKDVPDHIPHCFDYLRQSLMCKADTALEKSAIQEGKTVHDVTGWGVDHECRDWEAIMKWASEHRSDNSELIIPQDTGLHSTQDDTLNSIPSNHNQN